MLIEQAGVMELSGKIAAADDPDVLAPGGSPHGGMDAAHVSTDETDIGASLPSQSTSGRSPP